MAEDLKCCSACGEWKSRGEFHRDAKQKDGLMSRCKSCRKILRRISYEKNKPRQLAYQREYIRRILADPISKREFYWVKNLKRRYANEKARDANAPGNSRN